MGLTHRAFCSGDVLLSHNLSSHYHRGCSVSLPCSEWERVGPLRYDHQRRKLRVESWWLGTTTRRSALVSDDDVVKFPKNSAFRRFSDVYIQEVFPHFKASF